MPRYLNPKLTQNIDQKLTRLNQLRPLPAPAVLKLKKKFEVEMVYNSNAIEGNSLTLKETFLVINEGITINGKPLKDHLEVKGHQEALDYLYSLVQPAKKIPLSERLICRFNQLVTQGAEKNWGGIYRNSGVIISGSDHTPPEAAHIPHEMRRLIKWLKTNRGRAHTIELAARLHHKIVYIHPFFDGNGRTARLIMNILLMRAGYPLVIILKNDQKKYYRVLDQADKGDIHPLVRFIAQAVNRSLEIYLKILTPASLQKEKYLPLSKIAPQTPYSPKYLNLLAGEGLLEAHKEGRNWLTSKESIERYIRGRERARKL